MDLSRVHEKMLMGKYLSLSGFCRDMRLVFSNSRTYNTNKRSRVSWLLNITGLPLWQTACYLLIGTECWLRICKKLWTNNNKKVSYCKHITHQHSSSTLQKFSSHLVWSPCKMWLLFLILCACMWEVPNILGCWSPPLGIRAWMASSNTLLPHMLTTPNFVAHFGIGQGVQNFGDAGPRPSGWGRGWPLETCFCFTCVTVSNLSFWVKPYNRNYGGLPE